MLMAGLIPLQPFGISVDFPVDESVTGEDMDWEFVNENAVDGRRYLRLHIQAKRAIYKRNKKPYWLYRELDHALSRPVVKGTGGQATRSGAIKAKKYGMQHKALIDEAAKIPGCIPLYMFYHPQSAVEPRNSNGPAIEGLNWIFADKIPNKITSGRWPVADRKLEKWRPHFHPLSKLLCFGSRSPFPPSPGRICDRLNEIRGSTARSEPFQAVEEIPDRTIAALRFLPDRRVGEDDIARPRIIFNSGDV